MTSPINTSKIASYKNNKIVQRIAKDGSVSIQNAETMFEDLKLFMLLAGHSNKPLAPSFKIDVAWHTFLMYTTEYSNFCKNYIGKYINHNPYSSETERVTKGKAGYERAYSMALKATNNNLSQNWDLEDPKSGGGPSYDCDSEGGNESDPSDWTHR